jgi:hypothetical protein
MTDGVFGYEVISAITRLKELMPKLDRRVEQCDPDAIRLFRSLSFNNCRARANGEIDLRTFENYHEKINRATEKFIEECICQRRK